MANKTYAVVHVDTGIVFAKNFVRNYSDCPKINNAKLAIMDYGLSHEVREVMMVITVNLSSTKKHIDQIKDLDVETHIINSDCPEYDYIFLARNPAALFEKLGLELCNEK